MDFRLRFAGVQDPLIVSSSHWILAVLFLIIYSFVYLNISGVPTGLVVETQRPVLALGRRGGGLD